MMKPRILMNPSRFGDVFKAMFGLNAVIDKSTLEHTLIDLVKVRASQINGCGYCIDITLTLAVVAINGWNRFSIAFNATPGTYQAGSIKRATA
jgi:alkylhydroperoxidase family enzyme